MDTQGSQNLMNNMIQNFVRPEVERRAQEGIPFNEEIWAAQVVFDAKASAPQVRINREVRLLACPAGSVDRQDYVVMHEAGHRQFTSITLPEEQKDIRHMTLCQTNVTATWGIFFSLGEPRLQEEPTEGSATFETGYEPPPLTEWEAIYADHDRIVEKVLAFSSPTPENPIEVLMAVALQRSRHLLDAYLRLVAVKNLMAASALIRMQLDSVMRVNACFLVADPLEIWEALKNGESWRRVKSKDGNQLSDAYLNGKLTEKFAWAADVYKQMSGYIHLSRPHLESTTEGEEFLGMVLFQGLDGERVKDQDIAENGQLFIKVTRALFSLCEDYAQSRRT